MDTETQIHALIERNKDALEQGLARRKEESGDITDITTAARVQELREDESLDKDDLTLTINTDGSPVFKSSKTSVWPLQYTVNELPPNVRFRQPVLSALWFGSRHPNMQTFLGRVLWSS
ncbi:hypothetical protein MTO96_038948 [Rhipicephalus appendiculatus]